MLLTISWFEFAMLLLRGWNWDLCFVSNDFSIFRYAQFEGSLSLFICAGTARHWTVFGLICSVREYLEDWRETRRKFYVESVWENLCSRQHKFSLTLFNWLFSFQRFNFYSNHAIKKNFLINSWRRNKVATNFAIKLIASSQWSIIIEIKMFPNLAQLSWEQ